MAPAFESITTFGFSWNSLFAVPRPSVVRRRPFVCFDGDRRPTVYTDDAVEVVLFIFLEEKAEHKAGRGRG